MLGHLDTFTSPCLVIQGDDDHNVDVQESIGLIRGLRSRGRPIDTLMFPDEMHGLSMFSNKLQAAQATVDFLVKYLGNATAKAG